jgi:hypothetical protein
MNRLPVPLDEREQVVEIAGYVDDSDRLRVQAELAQVTDSINSSSVLKPPGRTMNPSGELMHQRLALVERPDNVKLGESAVRDLALLQEPRNDPDHASTRRQVASATTPISRPCRLR